MNIIDNVVDYFRSAIKKKGTAAVAKERLQIIVSHERSRRNGPDYLPMLQKELIEVIAKYVDIDKDQVKVALEQSGNCAILELNITLPDIASLEEPQKESEFA